MRRTPLTTIAVAGGVLFLASPLVGSASAARHVPQHAATTPGRVPPGWPPNDNPGDPASQISNDTVCASNSVLLFSARGSGDVYGGDFKTNKLGRWTQYAGNTLVGEGWA